MNWTIFDIVFSPYNIDQKWYPFILIFLGIFVLIILYLIFSYIRAFIIWLNGNNEIIKLQKDTNGLLLDLIEIQNYQADEIEKIKNCLKNNGFDDRPHQELIDDYFDDFYDEENNETETEVEINEESKFNEEKKYWETTFEELESEIQEKIQKIKNEKNPKNREKMIKNFLIQFDK